jgi:hypothetical protein
MTEPGNSEVLAALMAYRALTPHQKELFRQIAHVVGNVDYHAAMARAERAERERDKLLTRAKIAERERDKLRASSTHPKGANVGAGETVGAK